MCFRAQSTEIEIAIDVDNRHPSFMVFKLEAILIRYGVPLAALKELKAVTMLEEEEKMMKYEIEYYDNFEELRLWGVEFYSHQDEYNFFFLMNILNFHTTADAECIEITISKDISQQKKHEFVAMMKRYNVPSDVYEKITTIGGNKI